MNRVLWILQWLLAALFLFAGVTKLVIPQDDFVRQTHVSASLLRFVSVAEIAGALGLVLPGLLHIGEILTPLAAFGLVAIMAGATSTSLKTGGLAMAIFPLVIGLLLIFVAWKRLRRN
ncbi:MAG: DoxX family protein [Terriglobia bacterium]